MIYYGITDPFFSIEYFILFFLISFVPVAFLHGEYLLINSKSSLFINSNLGTLRYIGEHQTIELSFNQIAKVVLYLAPSSYRGPIERKMRFLPVEAYGYAIIYSRDGDKIIITSLMIPDIYLEFMKLEGIEIEKRKRLLASPYLEKVIQWINKDGL